MEYFSSDIPHMAGSIRPPWWKIRASRDDWEARTRHISSRVHLSLLPIYDCAVGCWYLGPFSGSPDAVLPSVGTCGGAAWLNIAPFALVEARRSSEECAGTDRAARRPPPFGRSCSARG